MIPAVYDCNVLIQAFAGTGASRQAWALATGGQVTPWATAATWAEYEARIPAIVGRLRPGTDTAPAMGALLRLVRFAPAQRLGRKVSRDPKDDPYLECAVAVRAAAVVTQDRDLLRLEKPFGIPMLTPSEFIHLVRG